MNSLEKNSKQPQNGSSGKSPLPLKILLWMDGGYSDASARFIRGYALAEALRKKGVATILYASPETDGAFLDCNLYRAELLDNTRKSSTADFWNCISQNKPDITIAEMVNPSRIQNQYIQQKRPFLGFVADAFAEPLFFAKVILLPGFIPYPNFEDMDLLPSHLDKILQGQEFFLLPKAYFENDRVVNPQIAKDLCIAISGHQPPKDILPVMEPVKVLNATSTSVFADVSEAALWQLRQEYKGEIVAGSGITVKQRIATIDRARLIIAFPSLPVYEFMARGKPVILLPRNEFEMSICTMLNKEGAAVICPLLQPNFAEELQRIARQLWEDEDLLRQIGENAARLITAGGAERAAEEILKRYALSC